MWGEVGTILGSCEKPGSSPCGPPDEGRLRVLELLSGSGAGRRQVSPQRNLPAMGRSRFSKRPARGAISRL